VATSSVGWVTTDAYREVAEAGWAWVLDHVRELDGPWLPDCVTEGWEATGPRADRDSLYAGIAGLAPVLSEITHSRPLTDAESQLAVRIAERLSAMAARRTEASLYDALAGDATALRMLAPALVPAVMQRLSELATPDGWVTALMGDMPTQFASDVVMGPAGVVMAAIWVSCDGAEAVALKGCDVLLNSADRTAAGLDWGWWPGAPWRGPNYSHGTAGIASAGCRRCGLRATRPSRGSRNGGAAPAACEARGYGRGRSRRDRRCGDERR
jgi:hypothetical protein